MLVRTNEEASGTLSIPCWNDVNVIGLSSFFLAKKLSALKAKLKELNRDVFGHLEFKMAKLVEKVKSLDEKEQQQ